MPHSCQCGTQWTHTGCQFQDGDSSFVYVSCPVCSPSVESEETFSGMREVDDFDNWVRLERKKAGIE